MGRMGSVGGGAGRWGDGGGQRRLGRALPGRSCLHHSCSLWPAAEQGNSEGLVMKLLAALKHYLLNLHAFLNSFVHPGG